MLSPLLQLLRLHHSLYSRLLVAVYLISNKCDRETLEDKTRAMEELNLGHKTLKRLMTRGKRDATVLKKRDGESDEEK